MTKIQRLFILAGLREKAQPLNTFYTWFQDDLYFLISIGYVIIIHDFYVISKFGLTYLNEQESKIDELTT